jgi:energy-coupling factor transport system permease protein
MSEQFEFSRNLVFPEYRDSGAWTQKRNSGWLIVSVLLYFSAVLLAKQWGSLLIGLVLVLVLSWLARMDFITGCRNVLRTLPLLLIIAAISLFSNPMGDISPVIWKWWMITITRQDLTYSGMLIFRFILLMQIMAVLTSSVSTTRFIYGLESILQPFTWIGISVHGFVVAVEIAIRYIPLLTQTAERIAKAQASRGATWGTRTGSLVSRLRQVLPVVVPLFTISYQRADKIAMAMDARGFGSKGKRSQYVTDRVQWLDALLPVVMFAYLLLVLIYPF